MNDTRLTPITAPNLLGLRVPLDTALAPGAARLTFMLSEPDFEKSEVRAQLFEASLTPLPAEKAEPREPREPRERQLTFALEDAEQPLFSPDGMQLGFISFRPQPHEEEEDDRREDGDNKRQVFLLPAAGGEARRLTEAAEGVEVFKWWPDGSAVVFIGQSPLSMAERATRRRRKDDREDPIVVYSEQPDYELWLQPLDGPAKRLLGGMKSLEEFDLSPDGKWLVYNTNHTGLPQDREKLEVILRDLDSGAERRLTVGRGGVEGHPRFTRDGRFVVMSVWADPQFAYSRQDLLAVSLEDPAAPARSLLASIDRDMEEFVPLCDGSVLASVASGMESRLVLIDPSIGSARQLPIEGWALRSLCAAPDCRVVSLVAERGTDAAEVALLDLNAPQLELRVLTDLNPDQRDWQRARRQRLTWSNEGLQHEGLLILPSTPTEVPPPLLVWLHGGPHWRVVDSLRTYEAEAFAAEGWAVFAPQYRGSSGYESAYTLANRGDLGGGDARDVLTGIDAVLQAGLADGARVAVGGASYGGYLTNWLLATTDRFKAGISMMGIFDFGQDWATSEYESWEEHYFGGRPWERPELYRERSPLSRAASINTPLLILHGLDDENTPVSNSRALFRALSALGRKTELVVYPREGHGFSEPAHRLDAFRRIREWLQRHISVATPLWVVGRTVSRDGVTLVPLAQHARRDYAGLRPQREKAFIEMSFVLRAAENGPTLLRLTPSGPESDVVLIDAHGDRFRPIGVPLDVMGHLALFDGRGHVEAGIGEDGRPPVLPIACIFELPDQRAAYELHVAGMPPLRLELSPHPDEDDDP